MIRFIRRFLARHIWEVLLALILLFAAYVRLEGLGRSSLWLDECFAAQFARFGIWDVIRTLQNDFNPPLSFLVSNLALRIDDTSEFVLRLPSALFGIGACIITYLLARMVVGRRFALLAALLLAFCPLAIDYSREARAYALITFEGAMATASLFAVCERMTLGRLLLLILSGSMLVYTHYVGIMYLLALLGAAVLSPGLTRQTKLSLIKAALIILVVFAPWLPYFVPRVGQDQPHIGLFTLLSVRDMFGAYGPFSAIDDEGLRSAGSGLFFLFVGIAAICAYAKTDATNTHQHAKTRLTSGILVCTFILFSVAHALLSIFRRCYWPKTMLVIYPLLMTLCAAGAASVFSTQSGTRSGRSVSVLLVLVLVVLSLVNAAQYEPPVHPDIRRLFAYLRDRPQSEPMVFCMHDAAPMVDFYLPDAREMYYSGRLIFFRDIEKLTPSLATLRNARRFWVVNTRPGTASLEKLASQFLRKEGQVEFDRCRATAYSWPASEE